MEEEYVWIVVQFLIFALIYQLADYDVLNNNDTFVYMKGNVAPITGYEIYAGTVKDCINLLTLAKHIQRANNFCKIY